MKDYKRKGENSVFILFFIWIFMIISVMMSTTGTTITWTKYQFEGTLSEVRCIPKETRFIKDGVSDQLTCGKTCFEDDECLSAFFHQENSQCIGCQTFQKDFQMTASHGFMHYSKRQFQMDCKDILDKKTTESGVYEIMLSSPEETLQVFCDMVTDGGGWTVFQNRFDGSVDFVRNFSDYENGFGDNQGEFWLGLKHIQKLTQVPSEVRYEIHLKLVNDSIHEKYIGFQLLGSRYTLSIDEEPIERKSFDENSVATFLADFKGADFSTSSTRCTYSNYRGGWWYIPDLCEYLIHLNGAYGETFYSSGSAIQRVDTIQKSRMMFRRI